MSAQPAVLQVVILRDGLLVGTEVFVPGQYTLGSSEVADLRLDDGLVEASHAYLYFQNGKVAIQDAGSANGVYVNGHKVATCEVRPVDELQLGPFTLKVRVLAQKPAAKGAPPADVAALLNQGGAAGAPTRPVTHGQPGKPPATVVSPRRLAAVPAAAPAPAPMNTVPDAPPPARPSGHLRPVEAYREDDSQTENFVVGREDETATEAMPKYQPPPPQARAVPQRTPAPQGRGQAPAAQKAAPHAARQAQATRAAPAKARKVQKPSLPASNEGKGRPRLFVEMYWGEIRRQARSFATITAKKPVLGAPDENADVPLFGFRVSEPFQFADQRGKNYRIFLPPGAAVEARGKDGNFYPLPQDQVQQSGQKRYVVLGDGAAIRLSGDGDVVLVAYVQKPLPRPFVNPLRGLPWLMLFLLACALTGLGTFVVFAPRDELPDFEGRKVPPVAVRLIAPEPKKKEEIKKKLEEIKAKEPKKELPKAKKEPDVPKVVQKAPETQALKAVAKLSAAGPAMKDLLAAVDKLGNGPGKKDAKDYKLSGLIGKQPIANAGLGTFGFGGGGSGGFGTKGAEILRGKGGGGIGALGAGNIGKGSVGGTVTHATARSVAAQGSIDREAVAKVINSHLQEVRACYERALLKDPSLAGKVVLEWTIGVTGGVTTARTKSSTLKNGSVEGCILTSLKGWKFPTPKGGVVIISYPFMFNSVGY